MKKILLFIVLCLIGGAAFAQMSAEQTASLDNAVFNANKGQVLMAYVKAGKISAFRKALVNAPHEALLVKDSNGNNILHAASSKEMFDFLWKILDENTKDMLLSEKNLSGEIPFMTHIMYGHEDIFLQYFPQTRLYHQLQQTTADLQDNGLNKRVAEIKRANLLKKYCTMGNQNMWQRAAMLAKSARNSAYTDPSKMEQIKRMISEVAPFMAKA